MDPISAVLSLAAVLPAVYGLKQIAADGPGWLPVLSVAAGLLFAVVFLRRQRALRHPLIDLRLFANRAFSTAVATLALGIFVLWGFNYAFAQYLQLVRGLSPLEAGLWTAPSAIGVIVGSTLASRIVRWIAPGPVIAAGLVLAAVGFVVVAQAGVTAGTSALALLVTGAIIVSAGLGPMMALATDMVVGSAPPEQAGAASAISSTAPQLGGALGIALLGSAITAVYRSEMSGAVVAGLPSEAVSAATESLGGAVTASQVLPGLPGAMLLSTARAAFSAGFRLSAVVSAVAVVGLAVTVTVMLGRGRSGAKPSGRR